SGSRFSVKEGGTTHPLRSQGRPLRWPVVTGGPPRASTGPPTWGGAPKQAQSTKHGARRCREPPMRLPS
ncbi:hypothetical protein NDU88_003409, partial [Pleurodeles waltl]